MPNTTNPTTRPTLTVDGYTYPLATIQGDTSCSAFLLRDDAGELPDGYTDTCSGCGWERDHGRRVEDWENNCDDGPRCSECGPCGRRSCWNCFG